MKRKIAAILSADVAGYSRLSAEDEEETLRRLHAYQGVFKEHISGAGGRIFNTAGDAVLAEFPSAVDGLRCAIDVQESLRTRNRAYPQSRQMSFRMGLTIGDVVDQDGDLLGDGVNVAARLQTLARPGGICISKAMYDSVANKLSVSYADMGNHQLKNIPSPVHAYAVVMDEKASSEPRARAWSWPPSWLPSLPKSWPSSLPSLSAIPLPFALVAAMVIGAGVAALSTGIFSRHETPTEATPVVASGGTPSETKSTSSESSPPSLTANGPESMPAASPAPPEVPAVAVEEAKPVEPEPSAATASEPEAVPSPPPEETKVATLPPDRASDTAAMARLRPIRWSECKGEDAELALTGCRALISDSATSGGDLALAHRHLAYALRKKGDVDGAITSFTKSIDIAASAEAYNDRGIAYLIKGQSDLAIEDYNHAISIDANNGDAYNNRAWTYFKLGRFREALSDADRAIRLIPNKAYAWDTRGHIHEALGNRRSAIQDFDKALTLDPTLESSTKALKRLNGS